MDINFLARSINRCLRQATDLAEMVQDVRRHVSQVLDSEIFLAEALDRLVSHAEQVAEGGNGQYQPLYIDTSNHWRMVIFLWDPQFFNEPHQHNTWSVSGVMLNRLDVRLYTRNIGSGELVLMRHFEAGQGETGYLVPPCVHSLGNPDPTLKTVTLHVFCDSEEEEARALDTIWLGGNDPRNRKRDVTVRTEREIKACLLLLKGRGESWAKSLRRRIFELGNSAIQLEVYKQSLSTDSRYARVCGERLVASLSGIDRNRFIALHQRIYAQP